MIRNGAWDYDKLVAWAEAEDAYLTKLYGVPSEFAVPKEPDRKALENFVVTTIQESM